VIIKPTKMPPIPAGDMDAPALAREIKRRDALMFGAAAFGLLAACGGDDPTGSDTSGGSSSDTDGSTGNTNPTGTTTTTSTGECPEPAPTTGQYVFAPGEGENLGHATLKVATGRMSQNFGMMEATVGPGCLLVPHTHELDDQAVYVIEGDLTFEFGGDGGEVVDAPEGSYVIKPRGISHSFWNSSNSTVRYIELSTRWTFEPMVRELDGAEGLMETNEIAEAYGVTMHYDRIPQMLIRYGLTCVQGMEMDGPNWVPDGSGLGG